MGIAAEVPAQIVTAKAIEILETHESKPLPEDISKRLEEITEGVKNLLADKHFVA